MTNTAKMNRFVALYDEALEFGLDLHLMDRIKLNTAEDGCNEAKCKTERDRLRDELKQQQEANDKLMAEREKLASQVRIQQQQHKNQLQIADETQSRATAAMEKLKKTLRSRDKTLVDMTEQTKKLQEKNCRLSDEWSHMKSELNKAKELIADYQHQHTAVVNRQNATIQKLSMENNQLRELARQPDRRDACIQANMSTPLQQLRTSENKENHHYESINLSDIIATVQRSRYDIHATVSSMSK